jgi:D-3-phosphoglycerate dehydrogenase
VTTDRDHLWVEGTVLHKNHLHLVSLQGIDVDAPLGGYMLILNNEDTPGVIGRVGTILGDNGVNIANFALGRGEDSREAIGVVNVDSEVRDDVLQQLRSLQAVRRAVVVKV